MQSHLRRELLIRAVDWNLKHCFINASLNCGASCCSSSVLVGSSQVASLPASQTERADGKEALSAAEATVHFVLEEGSGYMEPTLHFLAVAHTIISFCCIIGYYCLKVHWLCCPLLYPNNKLALVCRACFKALEPIAHQPANISLFQRLSRGLESKETCDLIGRCPSWSSNVRRKSHVSWSLMGCSWRSYRMRKTLKASGTDWSSTHRMFRPIRRFYRSEKLPPSCNAVVFSGPFLIITGISLWRER